jgi:hypothetical protein
VSEIVLHVLRLRESVGSFSVLVPQQLDYPPEVPCTVQTVSFVLAAVRTLATQSDYILTRTTTLQLAVELEEIVGHTSSETITEYIARFGVLQGDILSVLKSIDERRNGHLDEQQSEAVYWGLHSFLQLTPLTDNTFLVAGAAHTTTETTNTH